MTVSTSPRSEILALIARRRLDYEATVDLVSGNFGRDAAEGAIFELLDEGVLVVSEGVLQPARRTSDRTGRSARALWEYKAEQAPYMAQLVSKLNTLAEDGWELVAITQETSGPFTPQLHVALLKRQVLG